MTITKTAPAPDSRHTENHRPRLNAAAISPDAMKAQMGLEHYVRNSSLEASLVELIKVRASYLNGCAYCVDMHTKDARAAGETEQRLYAVGVWRETPFFTPRERAALAYTDAATLIANGGISDELYDDVRQHFSEREMLDLVMAVIAINGWNRLTITCRTTVGSYRVPAK